ncbi:MAG: tRNA (guanosine(37)-N1)-methyltransferase TrmD [Gammaproteobacteria bacterium]|nr:tRNA (guanosine(37)-N1)-methyltransferase TrmD [Gammaproteobacteria bacterium]
MHIEVVSLFPELVEAGVSFGVIGRAMQRGLASMGTVNPREFADDRHRTVDDRPYGGGPGMVMKVEPLRSAIYKARERAPKGSPVIYLSAQGGVFDQARAQELASLPGLILVAGRYEGVDERLVEREVDEELSIGDYVLSGGELPALVVIDAVLRLLPGVLGDEDSAEQDSFAAGLLDCPHYTRPEEVDGLRVPEVLLGGNHEQIRQWRLKQALGRTWLRRPELLEAMTLDVEQQELLSEFIAERGGEL